MSPLPTLAVQVKPNKRPRGLDAVKQKCVLAVNTVGRRLCKQAELVLRRTDCGRPFPVRVPSTATAAPSSRADTAVVAAGEGTFIAAAHGAATCPRRLSNLGRLKASAHFFGGAGVCVDVAGNICLAVAGSAPPLSLNHPELTV